MASNYLIDNEEFDDGLESLFSDNNFYANPKSTKIYFNYGTDKDYEEIVGNAVVANIEETNEKIPVYSYNSSTYQKYLQGKRIITGVIALRKITVATFLSLLKRTITDTVYANEKADILNQINELNKITSDGGAKPTALIMMLRNKLSELETKRTSNYSLYSENDRKMLGKDDLLYYIENANKDNQIGGNTAKIRIEFQNSYEEGPKIKIKDVLFIKKQTEINIDKNDIFEVYNFIGNPDLD